MSGPRAPIRGAFVLLLLLCAAPALATPVRMTFEGTVFTLVDTGGVAAAAGIGPGSTLRYTVLVDLDADGFVTTDGVHEIRSDEVTADTARDVFFATYLSGDHLGTESAGNQPNQLSHVGQNETELASGARSGGLYTGNLLTFGVDGLFVDEWSVGTVAYARDWWVVGGTAGHVATFATLTELVVVPEPTTAALLASGLLALAAGARHALR